MSGPEHTYSVDCLHCGDGRPGTRCDLSGYSARRVRFILAHREAYDAAYLNPSHEAARNELARLAGEYRTLPPRHDCSCTCPNERRGWPRCSECKRLDDQRPKGPDVAVEIGRTSPVNAPMPPALMLDLERALSVLGDDSAAHQLAAYMSLNGTSKAAGLVEHHEQLPLRPQPCRPAVPAEREVSCLMCSRPGFIGERRCRHCGGCLVLVTVD